MVDAQAEEEESGKRSSLLSTAMALAGVAMVATSMAGSAEAVIQKVEGTEREEQDAVTTGIREPSRLSAAKSNTVQEAGKSNTQVTIIRLLTPKLQSKNPIPKSSITNTNLSSLKIILNLAMPVRTTFQTIQL